MDEQWVDKKKRRNRPVSIVCSKSWSVIDSSRVFFFSQMKGLQTKLLPSFVDRHKSDTAAISRLSIRVVAWRYAGWVLLLR